MPSLVLLPAVDVAGGQAVRLVRGEAGTETSYGDPLAAAQAWQEAGADWIHLVDLDAAFGRGENRALLANVVGRVDVQVELSGGIRDDASLSTSARPPWRTPPGARPRSPDTGSGSRSGSTCGARRSRRGAGPRTAASCSRCWPASTRTAARATSSPMSAGTAR